MAQKTQNLKGQKFAVPTNPGIYIGKDWRGKVVDLLNCFYNPKIQIKTVNSVDNQTILTDSDVQMGPLGWVATIDLTNAGVGNGGSGGGSGSGLIMRGEYSPTATYQLNDITVISSGINQGTFACIISGGISGIAPYTGGGNWIQLPGGLLGAWM